MTKGKEPDLVDSEQHAFNRRMIHGTATTATTCEGCWRRGNMHKKLEKLERQVQVNHGLSHGLKPPCHSQKASSFIFHTPEWR